MKTIERKEGAASESRRVLSKMMKDEHGATRRDGV